MRRFAYRRFLCTVLVGVFGAISFYSPASASLGVPRVLSYQGRLLDASGNLLGGSGTDYCFRFSFYTDATVGAPDTKVWPTNTPSSMTAQVKNGVFSVGIGDTSAAGDLLDYAFQDNDSVYLNVDVATKSAGTCGSYETLSPRQRILASAFSLTASSVVGTGQSALGTTTPIVNAVTTIEATSTSAIPLVIRGFANQVADLFRIVTAGGTQTLTFTNSGYLGIGTSSPSAVLSVKGGGAGTGRALAVSDSANTERFTILDNGSVGIGTTSPSRALSVGGALLVSGAGATSTFTGNGIDLTGGCFSVAGVCIGGGSGTVSSGTANRIAFYASSGTSVRDATTLVWDDANGFLGIGTTSPFARLSIAGVSQGTTPLFSISSSTASATSTVFLIDSMGNVGIGTSSPTAKLAVVGNIKVSGCLQAATSSYNISPENNCLDLAESYPAGEDLMPGDLVTLSTSSPFRLMKASSTSKVLIGIISDRPAILLEGENASFGSPSRKDLYLAGERAPLALVGRVPLKVNGEGGSIRIGDRLSASSRPGEGMRASTSTNTNGVGIALQEFDIIEASTTGMILVFVNLSHADTERQDSLAGFTTQDATTTTATTTPSFVDAFFVQVRDALSSLGATFRNGIAYIQELVVKRVTTETLCLEDVCLTKTDIQAILKGSGVASTSGLPSEVVSVATSTSWLVIGFTGTSTDPVSTNVVADEFSASSAPVVDEDKNVPKDIPIASSTPTTP